MDNKKMVKSITDWKPLGKKAKGKPRKRWMDDILDDTKNRTTNWMENARKGETWYKVKHIKGCRAIEIRRRRRRRRRRKEEEFHRHY